MQKEFKCSVCEIVAVQDYEKGESVPEKPHHWLGEKDDKGKMKKLMCSRKCAEQE